MSVWHTNCTHYISADFTNHQKKKGAKGISPQFQQRGMSKGQKQAVVVYNCSTDLDGVLDALEAPVANHVVQRGNAAYKSNSHVSRSGKPRLSAVIAATAAQRGAPPAVADGTTAHGSEPKRQVLFLSRPVRIDLANYFTHETSKPSRKQLEKLRLDLQYKHRCMIHDKKLAHKKLVKWFQNERQYVQRLSKKKLKLSKQSNDITQGAGKQGDTDRTSRRSSAKSSKRKSSRSYDSSSSSDSESDSEVDYD